MQHLHEYTTRTIKGGTETLTWEWTRPGQLLGVTEYHPEERESWWAADFHTDPTEVLRVERFDMPNHAPFVTISTEGKARKVTIYLSPEQAAALKEAL